MELLLIRGEPVPVDGKNQLKSVDLVNTLLLPKDKYKVAQKALSNIPYVFDIQEVVGKIATATKIDPQLIWKQLTWKERVSRHTTKKKARVDEPKRQQGGPHQGPQRDFQEVHPKEQMVEVFDDEDLFDDDDDEDDDFESEGKGKEDLQEEEIHQEQQQQLSSGDIAAMLQINANVLTALAAFAKTEEDQKSPLSVQIKTIGLLFAQAILELGPLTIAKKAGGGDALVTVSQRAEELGIDPKSISASEVGKRAMELYRNRYNGAVPSQRIGHTSSGGPYLMRQYNKSRAPYTLDIAIKEAASGKKRQRK